VIAAPRAPLVPRWLALVVAAYVALAAIYSVSTPILEAPDEMFHFPLVSHLADTARLPVQDPAAATYWHQEGSQPPLYYLLAAPLAALTDRDDLPARLERNPHAKIGVGLARDNQVVLRHDWDAESFPWHGTALGVHLVRFLSITLGAGTVIAIYHVARLTAPRQPALHLTAVLLAAFNPMFLFITASVNNDNLVSLLSAAALAQMLALWRGGLTARRVLALAVTLALATLSKLSGLALYPVAALVLLLIARRAWSVQRRERAVRLNRPPMAIPASGAPAPPSPGLLVELFPGKARGGRGSTPLYSLIWAGLVLLTVWIALAGWWYARNLALYGDPTGLNRMIAIIGARTPAPALRALVDEWAGLRYSFWGVFGMLNVFGPDRLFDYADALSLLALAGLLVFAGRAARSWTDEAVPAAILALHALIVFLALLNWTRRTPATQGRLLFPALGPLVTLAALGLAQWLPRASWRRALPLAAAPLVAFAALIPFTTLRDAYALPPTVDAPPADAVPIDARFGPIELLAVRFERAAAAPGSERRGLPVTLYWRPRAHTIGDMSFYVQALGLPGPDGAPALLGKLDSYPGRGLLRTSQWELNRIYADRVEIRLARGADTPLQPALKIGWRQFETGAEFAPETLSGEPRGRVIVRGGWVIGASQTLADGVASDALFGGALRLRASQVTPDSAAPGEAVEVRLEWAARARAYEDFTILVHLIDPAAPDQPPLAQGDSPPRAGHWPTSAWEPGAPFVDDHELALPPDLPPGEYRIAVGFYRPADFTRLPVETTLETLPGAVLLPQTLTVEGADAHD